MAPLLKSKKKKTAKKKKKEDEANFGIVSHYFEHTNTNTRLAQIALMKELLGEGNIMNIYIILTWVSLHSGSHCWNDFDDADM